jgi:GDP-4-dehydro-6-deoxy-D-mannose reductase
MKRRYLITGAQGLVGRYLTARIFELEKDVQVLGIGRSKRMDGFFTHTISIAGGRWRAPVPAHLLRNLAGRYRYQRLSLLETKRLKEVIRELQPHCIFHLASGLSTASQRDLLETNLEGTASLMNAVADAQPAKALVILGSSGSVYGDAASLPIPESHPCNPANMYGLTKLAAEHVTRLEAARCGIAWVTARIFNVVGPGQAESHVCGRLAAELASPASSRGTALSVGPLDTTRDFIDVRDVASALLLLARSGEHGGTYNVASGRETPIQLILSELLRISGLNGQVQIAPQSGHPRGVRRHFADVSRLQGLGFVPTCSLTASLEDLFRYYQELSRLRASSDDRLEAAR